jgi:hypothetical protein
MPTETANGQTVQPEFREKLVEKIEKLMTDGSPDASDPRLANVFVFDSFSADHYVSYDNSAAAFTPYGLDVLPTLSRVVSKPPSARRALKSTVGAERRNARVLKSSSKARHSPFLSTTYRRRFRPSLLAHCTEMRAGEIRALQLGDIHADDNAPSICHQIEHGCQANRPRWRRQRRPCESVGASVPTLPRTGSDE